MFKKILLVLIGSLSLVFGFVFISAGASNQLQGVVTPTVFDYLPIIQKPPPTPTNTPTPTATPLPTSTPLPPADVRLTYILYNPSGSDLTGEFVRIQNLGGVAANMTAWRLSDADNHDFIFPSFTLAPGATVQVWSKGGTNTATDLYWGQNQPIWTNTGDTAYLRNNSGVLIDSCSYPGGGTSAGC